MARRSPLSAAFGLVALAVTGCEAPLPEGELQINIADDLERGVSWQEYELQLADGRVIALDTGGRQLDLKTGTRVQLAGEWANPFRYMSSAVTPTAEPPAEDERFVRALIPSTPPTPRKVAVILLNFTDLVKEPLTVEQVRERVFTSATSTKAYFTENLYGWVILEGRDNIQGDVLGWYTIPSASTPCNDTMWGMQGLQAAQAAGADTAGYDHIVYWWPRTTACSYGGKGATSGGTRAPTGTFNYGRNTWINSDSGGNVVSHEFGHNFRMSHSGTRTCTDAGGARVTMSDTCTTSEYGSRFDVMGSGGHRHSIAYNKGRAGVIGKPNVITVRQGGTYAIQPIEKGIACGTQAIRISRNANNTEFYYVDYRTRTGFDAGYSATSSAINGVVITIAPNYETSYGNSGMLDMTPATTSFDDAGLLVGQTFTDPAGLVNITLESRDENAAQVRVAFPGGDPGTNADGCTTGTGGATGAAGTSGAAGTTGTGAGGRGGTTGTAGRGGSTGTAGTTAAAAGTTGAAGSIPIGGSTGAAGTTPTTGAAGTVGIGQDAGIGTSDGPRGPGAVTGGCACSVENRGGGLSATLFALALGAAPMLRRRRGWRRRR